MILLDKETNKNEKRRETPTAGGNYTIVYIILNLLGLYL
jgi:hypothetical protein